MKNKESKCQLYEIINNEIRYIYKGIRGLRQSKNRATTFTLEEGQRIVKEYSHHKLIIATERSVYFKETDENGIITNLKKGA